MRALVKDGIISMDVFSAFCDGTQTGESAMAVINSVTGKYEKVEVSGKKIDNSCKEAVWVVK